MLNQEWNIKPRKLACEKCQADFENHQSYMSRLVFNDQGYVRADFCMPCWTQAEQQRADAVSIWKGMFEAPIPQPEDPLKKENIETRLRSMMEISDPTKAGIRYLLAIILERKRILVEKSVVTREDGGKTHIYEHRKSGESFILEDPMLDFNQLGQIELEVKAMLSGNNSPTDTPAQAVADAGQPETTPEPESKAEPENAGPENTTGSNP